MTFDMKDIIEYPALKPLIVGASYYIPSQYLSTKGQLGGRYARFSEGMLLEPCIELAERLLKQLNISSENLDVITTLSLTSDHMAYERDIAGPRLCHPLQRELNAKNAWVFDMADSSLSSTLDLVQSYLLKNNKKFALIVRGDRVASVKPDDASGFSWSDGVGVLVVENKAEHNIGNRRSANVCLPMYNKFDPCILKWNSAIDSLEGFRSSIDFKYQSEMMDCINHFMSNLGDRDSIYETWIPFDKASSSQYTADNVFLGPLAPFRMLAELKNSGYSKLLTFNPFSLEVSAKEVEYSYA